MKTKVYLMVITLFTLSMSCTTKPAVTLQSNEWILKSITVQGKQVTLPENKPTLFFSDSARMSGFSGCNRFFGSYEQKESSLILNLGGSTMMSCPDMEFETKYTKMLSEVKTFKIKDHELWLKNKENKTEMVYSPLTHQESK